LQFQTRGTSNRHPIRYLAQHGDPGRGVPDVVIARTQAAHRHLEHFAEGHRFAERLPLEQLAGVPEISGGLTVIASMKSNLKIRQYKQ